MLGEHALCLWLDIAGARAVINALAVFDLSRQRFGGRIGGPAPRGVDLPGEKPAMAVAEFVDNECVQLLLHKPILSLSVYHTCQEGKQKERPLRWTLFLFPNPKGEPCMQSLACLAAPLV